MKQDVPLKRWPTFNSLHGVTSKKKEILITTTVRTSNLIYSYTHWCTLQISDLIKDLFFTIGNETQEQKYNRTDITHLCVHFMQGHLTSAKPIVKKQLANISIEQQSSLFCWRLAAAAWASSAARQLLTDRRAISSGLYEWCINVENREMCFDCRVRLQAQ
jgi:hypothetical protein